LWIFQKSAAFLSSLSGDGFFDSKNQQFREQLILSKIPLVHDVSFYLIATLFTFMNQSTTGGDYYFIRRNNVFVQHATFSSHLDGGAPQTVFALSTVVMKR